MCQRAVTPGTDQSTANELMKELWQAIPGYEGLYEASDQGQIRSLDRQVTQRNRWGTLSTNRLKGRLLRPGKQNNGRLYVNLSKDNTSWVVTVHKLVAFTFIGPRAEGMDIDHVNGDFLDNRASNLEYVSHQVNQKRAFDMGKLNPPLNKRSKKTGKFMSSKAQSLPLVSS